MSHTVTKPRSTTGTAPAKRINRGLVLALACGAQAMVGLDTAIVNVALPSIQRDLGVSHSTLQWVVVAYGLLLGGFLLLAGVRRRPHRTSGAVAARRHLRRGTGTRSRRRHLRGPVRRVPGSLRAGVRPRGDHARDRGAPRVSPQCRPCWSQAPASTASTQPSRSSPSSPSPVWSSPPPDSSAPQPRPQEFEFVSRLMSIPGPAIRRWGDRDTTTRTIGERLPRCTPESLRRRS